MKNFAIVMEAIMYYCNTKWKSYHPKKKPSLKEFISNNLNKFCCVISSLQNERIFSLSRARGPGFNTQSCYILLFLLPLIQEGQLSITGEVCAQSTG